MRIKLIIIKCGQCNNDVAFEAKAVKYRLRITPETKFFCSNICRTQFKKTGKNINCKTCGIIIYIKLCLLNKNGNFCSQSCSAIEHNKQRGISAYTTKGKTREIVCQRCGNDDVVSIHKKLICNICSKNRRKIKRAEFFIDKKCIKCDNLFRTKEGKYCNKCRLIVMQASGSKVASKQFAAKRSKNEIYFAELCKGKFSVVKENERIFDGWDADVIIEDIKTAVLWNGLWHFQKITKKHSVLQVQSRDKIKIDKIKSCGYTPYVIEDRGRHNKMFVEEQFHIFLEWVQQRG